MPIFLDIETLPQDPEAFMVRDPAELTPPGQYKKPESIAAWRAEQAATQVQELRERSGLEPLLGGIVLCVGIAVDDGPVKVLVGGGDETAELALLTQLERGLVRYPEQPLVAWHGSGFDFPFLARRALRHGLHTLSRRCYVAKPWGDPAHVDPHRAWQGGDPRAIGRLKEVAQWLGIPVDTDLDGSEVAAAYARGELARIVEHCRDDVSVLRQVYYHLRAAGWITGDDADGPDLPVRPPRVPSPPSPPAGGVSPASVEPTPAREGDREALMREAARAQVAATKNACREAAQAAGIDWGQGVEPGEAGPLIGDATTVDQLRTYVAQLHARAATLAGG